MDIKSRKFSLTPGAKSLSVLGLWVATVGLLLGLVYMIYFVNNQSYLAVGNIEDQYYNLTHNVTELVTTLKSEAYIKEHSSTDTQEGKESQRIQIERYRTIQDHLSNVKNFAYWIENTDTGEVITNLKEGLDLSIIKKQPTYYSSTQDSYLSGSYYFGYGEDTLQMMVQDTPYWINTAIIEPMAEGDVFYDAYQMSEKVKDAFRYVLFAMIALSILGFFSLVHLVTTAGYSNRYEGVQLYFFDNILFEFQGIALITGFAMIGLLLENTSQANMVGNFLLVAFFGSANYVIGLPILLSIVRRLKTGNFRNGFLTYRLFSKASRFVSNLLTGKMFKPVYLFLIIGYGLLNGICFVSMNPFMFFVWAGANIFTVIIVSRFLMNVYEIKTATEEIVKGNVDYRFNQGKLSPIFVPITTNIEQIQKGLGQALEEAVKGERMKTTLITNVSHDLKTPLTSIINYVDLLKHEEDREKTKEYINVLEEKSFRLKKLIEDLIEASKASTGNIQMNLGDVNLYQLTQQALGEFEETFIEKGLEIRMSGPQDLTIKADGQYMWRVIENLLTNVIKYAMENTRVYIQITDEGDWGSIAIKNTSFLPLDISPDQLAERFVRGDGARQTEGSGLGLSIAGSLISLQKGKFDIHIDGDLFKVTVKIPK